MIEEWLRMSAAGNDDMTTRQYDIAESPYANTTMRGTSRSAGWRRAGVSSLGGAGGVQVVRTPGEEREGLVAMVRFTRARVPPRSKQRCAT